MVLLGVRPYPEQNESLSGYFLRLATWNGFVSITELLQTIGVKKPKVRLWGLWKTEEIEDALTSLSVALNRSSSVIAAPFLIQSQRWMFSELYLLQELRVDFTRVCPECMKQEKTIDWRWNIASVARCNHHNSLLIDHCPQCHQPFEWRYQLFTGCTHCEFKWKSYSSETISPCTPFEQRLYPHEDGSLNATQEELSLLIQAMVFMARPFDARIDALQRVPYSPNHSRLVLNAFALLEDPSVQFDWQKRNQQKNGLFAEPIIQPKLKQLDFPRELEIKSIAPDFVERPEYVSRARNKLRMTDNGESVPYQVFHDELAALFAINKADLIDLINKKVLTSLNSTEVLRDQIFDYRKFAQLIAANFYNEIPEGWIVVDRKSTFLRQNLTEYGSLLTALLTKDVLGGFTDNVNVSSVIVEPERFQNWLQQQIEVICGEPISPTDAAKVLRCSRDEIDELVKQGILKWASWQRGATLVDGPSLYQYLLQIR
jgi:hypothetical protein